MPIDDSRPFRPLGIAVLTISDSRTIDDDRSGDALAELLLAAGHRLASRAIVADDLDQLVERLSALIVDPDIQCILTTGGTGITGRDVTPEAVEAVADKLIPGFGELFRYQSMAKIGTSTIQSRALGAVAGGTYIFALPGSPNAVKDGWNGILKEQLDSRFGPCNFVSLIDRLQER